MVSKELRKLNRRELIDIIYQMKKNEQQMQEQIAALQAELEEKRLRLSQTGSIAEAALAVTNIFSAAQEAADLYLQEISAMKAETERECQRILEQTRKAAADLHPVESPRQTATEPVRQADRGFLRKMGQMIRRWKKLRK
jgi:cell division septum initiation protein DivIVA